MSEDQRRMSRTQGKYGSGPQNGNKKSNFESRNREQRRDGDEEKKRHDEESSPRDNKKRISKKYTRKSTEAEAQSEQHSSPMKNRGRNLAGSSIEIKYQENAEGFKYSGLEEEHSMEVIKNSGWHQLSNTEVGISKIFYEPDFIDPNLADQYFDELDKSIKWHDKKIVINGEERPQPRLVAWFGPLPYSYSGVKLEPQKFPPIILEIKKSVEDVLKRTNIDVDLNSVLLNLYRNGKDSVAWHSDDESSMGIQPTIASVSLGQTRRFEMRKKPQMLRSEAPADCVVFLQHGSLVVMDGVMQTDWQHRVPKEYHFRDPRINLTFRTVYAIEEVPRSSIRPIHPYIPPPHPKKKQEPFQLEEEVFPTLGESIHRVLSKSQHTIEQQPMNIINNTITIIAGSESNLMNDSIATKTYFHNETEPANTDSNALVSHSAPGYGGILNDDSNNELRQASNENTTDNTDPCMDTDNPITNAWRDKNLDEVPVFVPESQRLSKSEPRKEHQFENRESTSCSPKEHESCSSHSLHQRRESGHTDDSYGKSRKSEQKTYRHGSQKRETREAQEINRMNDVYDFICAYGNGIPFRNYEWDELNILMTIVEYSESLPTHVITMLANRLERLRNNAEKRYYEQQQNHDRNFTRQYSGRNNSRNSRFGK